MASLRHQWPVLISILSGRFFRSLGWPLYTGLTVYVIIKVVIDFTIFFKTIFYIKILLKNSNVWPPENIPYLKVIEPWNLS
jgi:hypothetical protein